MEESAARPEGTSLGNAKYFYAVDRRQRKMPFNHFGQMARGNEDPPDVLSGQVAHQPFNAGPAPDRGHGLWQIGQQMFNPGAQPARQDYRHDFV